MSHEIVDGSVSGGTNTSHTIIFSDLRTILDHVPRSADFQEYASAVLEDNILGKDTIESRRRTLRYLRELYILRNDSLIFRALRDLWNDDPSGQPLLAGLCALARDPVFRASAQTMFDSQPGDEVINTDLADAVAKSFPDSYGDATLAKIGRNTFSSWEQTGHLESVARTKKVRKRAVCTPSTTAFALFLGHLEGLGGVALFDTVWAWALDRPRAHLIDLAVVASQRSLIDFRHSGGITEVRFAELLRPMKGQLL